MKKKYLLEISFADGERKELAAGNNLSLEQLTDEKHAELFLAELQNYFEGIENLTALPD